MAKKSEASTELAPVDEKLPALSLRSQVPDFMKADGKEGLQEVAGFVQPPRIKVVHKMAKEPYNKFPAGTVLLAPSCEVVVKAKINMDTGKPEERQAPFFMVPLLFYPEWICWNPLELKGTLPSVVESTTDPSSRLAAKCQDRKFWFEPALDAEGREIPPKDGKPMRRRNIEHLNFVCAIYGDHELAGTTVLLSYAKVQHKHGTGLCGLIQARNSAIYGNVFQFNATYGSNDKGDWFAPVACNPEEETGVNPFVTDPALYAEYRDLHRMLKAAKEAGNLKSNLDDDDVIDVAPVGGSNGEF